MRERGAGVPVSFLGDEMTYEENQPQCDPIQQAREIARAPQPQPAPQIAQAGHAGAAMNLNAATGGTRPQGGLDGMCSMLYGSLEALETMVARMEQTMDPIMGPEVPTPEAPSQRAAPMVNSRIGHQLQEMNSRIIRVTTTISSMTSRVDI